MKFGYITGREFKVKTRQEIFYDFLLALTANPKVVEGNSSIKHRVDTAWELATALTDKYFENLS
jgi:hypothetical protein